MNYPNNIKKTNYHKINKRPCNRGMTLENMINESNEYYANMDIAYIYKKPTPIQIVDVSYPSRNKAVITKAFYTKPSTTDYNGIYNGYYIDFEAKETDNKTLFSLTNLKKHQISHLTNVMKQRGVGFVIIRFSKLDQIFVLDFEKLHSYLSKQKVASLSLEYLRENAILVNEGYRPRLDYLKAVNIIIKQKENVYEK